MIMSNHPLFSDKQADFFYSDLHDYNILSGVTGSGKSFAVNLKFYKMICEAPAGSLFLVSANTEDSLYDNVIAPLMKIDYGVNWLRYSGVTGKKRIIVKTGTQVVCVGASTEKAQDRIQGKSVSGWYGDEIVKQPRSFIDMANSRCRQSVGGQLVKSPIIWTCNPDHPSHFIKTEYIDNDRIDVRNWYFGFYDNPLMNEKFIDDMKSSFSGVFLERMIYGKWVIAEGAIYIDFGREKQVVDVVPELQEYFWSLDWGYENPMAILLMA